ncbi:MAG: hypothetical protein D6689_02560 [Deltaproteobacteria bacterium]|nr:MAG: hypothetical protein D6689_02560 [Deltaproteobacteria bacterium]
MSALRYVYVAMADQDVLAKIDGRTLAVTSIHVGDQPEVLAAVPGTDAAIVLDSINGTATIVRPTVDRDATVVLPTLPRLNALSVDPTGAYAVAWFDLAKAAADAGGIDAVGEVGSFQDVTVLRLAAGAERAVDLTVGFRPREVEFDAAGRRAYVVTDDGVSAIDLAQAVASGPSIVAPVPVTADPLADPSGIEVAITASGQFAVVREADRAELRVVRVAGTPLGEMWTIPLPSVPTDVDLAPGGARAYAVLREQSQLAVIDVPEDALDPSGVEFIDLGGETVGSLVLSEDGARGLLFTNAAPIERLTVVELTDPPYPTRSLPLQKSVRLAAFDPQGDSVIVVHAKQPGDPGTASTLDEYIDRSYGYSVVDVATGFAKLQVTPVAPGPFAFATTRRRAYLILDGGDAEGAVARVHTIELDTGVVRERDLRSPPDAVGILPAAGVAFVSQRHALGRVSFIDVDTDAIRTVTGFDLNGRIID